jgi:hypothetical protein
VSSIGVGLSLRAEIFTMAWLVGKYFIKGIITPQKIWGKYVSYLMLNPPDCLFFLEAVPLWWQSQIHSGVIWMMDWTSAMLSVCL